MAVILFFWLGVMVQDLLIEDYFVSPDEKDLYEAIEDSLVQLETQGFYSPRIYRFLLRAGVDSFPVTRTNTRGFARFKGHAEKRDFILLIDKDKCERNWADFIGGGISLANNKWRLSLGDFLVSFGCGLILTTPSLRAGFRWNLVFDQKSPLAQTAQENRNLRGIRVDYQHGRFFTAFLGSYSLRDALLNSDGTVFKLSFSGVHDSSSMLNKVGQKLAGALIDYKFKEVSIGGAGYWVNYDQQFSPPESVWSFYGQTLSVASCHARLGNSFRFVGIELARSSSGSMAAGVHAGLDTVGIRAGISGTVYQARFFSPAGRVYSLTRRYARSDLNGKISYKLKIFRFALEGNSYRDFVIDSIPARLDLSIGLENNETQIRVFLGRIYRMEQERFRRARTELVTKWRQVKIKLLIEDRYADFSNGRGVLLSLNTGVKIAGLGGDFAVSRFIIGGSGVLLTVPEPGTMRMMSGYSSDKSGWRFVLASYLRTGKSGRMGCKIGASKTERWEFDLSGQLELEANCD
ncbi:MAG: hypothetical protein ACUVUD_04795 [bacterium]